MGGEHVQCSECLPLKPSDGKYRQSRIPFAKEMRYPHRRAAVVVEGATVQLCAETTTMIVIGIILSIVGIGFLCWLLFTLAVYALPFFAGLTVGLAAFHGGSGVLGAIFFAVIAGAVTLVTGQIAFAIARTPLTRSAIALLFAAPAGVAGYQATMGLAHIGVSSQGWCDAFAILGAILVGGTAWARMTHLASPLSGNGVVGGLGSDRFAGAATTDRA
jgi:hypothetical protein